MLELEFGCWESWDAEVSDDCFRVRRSFYTNTVCIRLSEVKVDKYNATWIFVLGRGRYLTREILSVKAWTHPDPEKIEA